MKTLILTATMSAVALTLAIPAQADPDGDYLNTISSQPGIIGGPVNNAVYLGAGHHACDLIASGVTPDDAANQMVNFYVTPYIAKTMVTAAKQTLCP